MSCSRFKAGLGLMAATMLWKKMSPKTISAKSSFSGALDSGEAFQVDRISSKPFSISSLPISPIPVGMVTWHEKALVLCSLASRAMSEDSCSASSGSGVIQIERTIKFSVFATMPSWTDLAPSATRFDQLLSEERRLGNGGSEIGLMRP